MKTRTLIFLIICALFLYTHLFVLPAVPILYEEDHLGALQDAWRMFRGEIIYRDFFQITFPGTQLLYLFFFNIFGAKFWVLNFVIFLIGLTSTGLILAISKKIISNQWTAYLPACLFLFFGFRWFGIDGHHRMISPVFVLLAVFVLLKNRSNSRILAAGVFCALASFFTQQRGILAVGATAFFILWETLINQKDRKRFFSAEIILFSSFGLTLIFLISPFLYYAGTENFLNNTFFYLSNYVQDSSANYQTYFMTASKLLEQGVTISVVMIFYYALIPLIYPVVLLYLWFKRKEVNIADKERVFLIALTGFFLSIGTFAPNPGRLFQISAPALILFVWLVSQKVNFALFPKLAVVGLVVFGVFLSFRLQTNWEKQVLETRSGNIAFLSPVVLERYRWLNENAAENEYVFEVYQSVTNFPLQLRNPTQVPFLLNTGYTPKWQVAQSIENLEEKQARYVIWDDVWTNELREIDEGENLGPLYEYLIQNYELKKSFTPYNNRRMQLWERKSF